MPTSKSDKPRDDDESAGAVASWMRLADEALGAAAPAGEDRRQGGQMGGSRARVLVVEDDASTRDSVMSALGDVGISCLGLPDGTAALAECQRRDPDLIVLDLALPGLDGARFADAYRRIPGSRARIIVVSGTERGTETAARIRADAFFSKPFKLDALVSLTEQLLRAA
jgi:DNA-binding response OmpR family regulator